MGTNHKSTPLSLEALGLTADDIRDRIIEGVVERIVSGDDELRLDTKLREAVTKSAEARIDALFQDHIAPRVSTYLETLVLQETNKWGEARGQPVTFVEYLVQRCEAYMQEKVDYQGKGKVEGGYGWSGTQTRITHLIHQHLHYHIQTAVQIALKHANASIAGGIEQAVKLKLQEVLNSLPVDVKAGR